VGEMHFGGCVGGEERAVLRREMGMGAGAFGF
jgi:hypothetical protein